MPPNSPGPLAPPTVPLPRIRVCARATGEAVRPPGSTPAGPAGRTPVGNAGRAPAPPGPARRPTPIPRRPRNSQEVAGDERLRALAGAFIVLYLEVEAGRRSRRQVATLMSPVLAATIAPVWVRTSVPRRVVSIRGVRTSADTYEAVAVVRGERRVGAVAVRLARHGTAWRVEDASRPEDGVLPRPLFALPDVEPDAFDLVGIEPSPEPLPGDAEVPELATAGAMG